MLAEKKLNEEHAQKVSRRTSMRKFAFQQQSEEMQEAFKSQQQQLQIEIENAGIKPIKPGTEIKQIRKWEKLDDELEELQKIYFTFLKRWTVGDRKKSEPNKHTIYDINSDEEIFTLETAPMSFGQPSMSEDPASTRHDNSLMRQNAQELQNFYSINRDQPIQSVRSHQSIDRSGKLSKS